MGKTKAFILSLLSLALIGCDSTSLPVSLPSSDPSVDSTSQTTSQSTFIDYSEQAKLTTEYSGKAFLTDGIGEVTLSQKIDGDTAHFRQKSGATGLIKGRYNCIDTPESTGMIEPWGHGASEFNGEWLNKAKHIVLSTDSNAESKPAVDSTGGRYLVYVWVTEVESPTLSDFKLLNLLLCQYGWSKAKGTSKTDYANIFISASTQAQAAKLHVWSDEEDPDFNYADPVTINLKMINEGVGADGEAYDWVDSKVTFHCFVAGCGPDKGAAYVVDDITWMEGETEKTQRYGIYIFTQYIEYGPLTTEGNELEVSGTVSEYNGVKQIVDVSYSPFYQEDYDMKVLSTGNTIEPLTGTAAELAQAKNVNCIVTANLVCTGGYATQNTATTTAYAFTLYCHDKDNPSQELNIRIVDSISIKDSSRKRVTEVTYFQGAEYITITGGLVTYTDTRGNTSFQVTLCKAKWLTLHWAE